MYLYHYFDKEIGPFVNLSDIPLDEAKAILNIIKETKPNVQSAKHHPEYMVVEHSPWLSTWFENSAYIKIPLKEFDLKTVSFTYGDSHPVFSPRVNKMDGKEYRKRLYTYEEILEVIKKYGLPQDWNNDGSYGPERYIEAHIWSDETIGKYRTTTFLIQRNGI